MGCTVVDKGDLAAPIPETQTERDPHKKYVREIARVCQKLYQQVYQAHEEGALPIVLGGDHSLAAGSVGASADFAAAQGRRDRPALDRRARRHEHAGDDHERQRARHAARGAARPRAGGARRASAHGRRRCAPTRRCSSASAISTTLEKERIRDAQASTSSR